MKKQIILKFFKKYYLIINQLQFFIIIKLKQNKWNYNKNENKVANFVCFNV